MERVASRQLAHKSAKMGTVQRPMFAHVLQDGLIRIAQRPCVNKRVEMEAIVQVQTPALVPLIILESIAERQYASKTVPTEDGVSRPILASAHLVIAAMIVVSLCATRVFLFLFVRCQNG